jgi:hypothetical protein
MKREAHARVAMIKNIEPKNQVRFDASSAAAGASVVCVCECLVHIISMIGPLYNVIIIAPATVTTVPTNLAWHLILLMSNFSILV